jgi:hypothetical protein
VASAGPGTEPRPAGLAALTDPEVVWNVGTVGDCLAQVPDQAELVVIACTEPHDLQRYASGSVVDLGIPTDAPFDQEALTGAVTAACFEAFERFVGRAPAHSDLHTAQTRPNAETWSQGDRDYHCSLGIEGVRVVGDARGSTW